MYEIFKIFLYHILYQLKLVIKITDEDIDEV